VKKGNMRIKRQDLTEVLSLLSKVAQKKPSLEILRSYERVVPKFSSYDVTVDPKKLSKIVKRANDIGISHAKVVAGATLSFAVVSEERDEVALVYRPDEPGYPDDEEHVFGLNLAFLLDALKGAASAKLSLSGSLDPIRIDSDNGDRIAVLMPCRI